MRHILRKRRTHRKRRLLRKKRRTRKQSGGIIDMAKLNDIIKQRSHASDLADISAKKSKELKEKIEMF